MRNPNKEKRWKKFCKVCGHDHFYHIEKCPYCQVFEIPMPVSESVYHYDVCDGCEAYNEHLR